MSAAHGMMGDGDSLDQQPHDGRCQVPRTLIVKLRFPFRKSFGITSCCTTDPKPLCTVFKEALKY